MTLCSLPLWLIILCEATLQNMLNSDKTRVKGKQIKETLRLLLQGGIFKYLKKSPAELAFAQTVLGLFFKYLNIPYERVYCK